MVEEVLKYLDPREGEVIVDGTVGTGGHSESIARKIGETGRLIAIDRDPSAIDEARKRLDKVAAQVSYHCQNFRDILSVISDEGLESVNGILLDLGVSSLQLDDPARGFSFRLEGDLDMRMGPDAERSAAQIINEIPEEELVRILYQYGEERWARRIAQFIVESRTRRPIKTTHELSQIVQDAIPVGARRGRKFPARKTFQALRIAVNDELTDLKEGISRAIECLAESGRIVVLSYHSLEDRIVKHTFSSLAKGSNFPPGDPLYHEPVLELLTRRPVTATAEEIEENPRGRSAKLRAATRRTHTLEKAS
ncbi:MAG: 16S rRNA (cytosine(1402)-N(4))-methyltransferase RsmH [Actinobacteria bacterium]|nr:16S rRNA (cytosine(1402)-N(4))-methyltransferase RsmH [Actinomycetota bacterium]